MDPDPCKIPLNLYFYVTVALPLPHLFREVLSGHRGIRSLTWLFLGNRRGAWAQPCVHPPLCPARPWDKQQRTCTETPHYLLNHNDFY